MREPLLSVEDLRVEFWTSRGTVHAVNGISFDIAPGETLGIVGESGCGKSVTSLALLGILPRAGRVPVGQAIFGERDLLRLRDYPHQFSGGMRQRAMIAIALACEPKLLIADEPTTALDVTIQAQILNLLRELVAERDTALIMITHDLGVVAGTCERVNVMYGGMVMETGEAEDVFASPRHPYTLGLLQSVPRLDAPRGSRLHPIEGAPRDMLHAPQACPFQPRCRFGVAESREQVPPLVEIEPDHFVACFNPVPADEWERERAVVA